MGTEMQKKYRERANRARRSLLKEKATYGSISDGAGKRYRVGVFYVLSGDPEQALDFYHWFQTEFPDDIGEPVCDLYWALAAHRTGRHDEARVRLRHAMLLNPYLLPRLFGEPWRRLDIWHGSNRAEPDYLDEVAEFLEAPDAEERAWMKRLFQDESFRALRDAFIDHFGRLARERDIDERGRILDSWDRVSRRLGAAGE